MSYSCFFLVYIEILLSPFEQKWAWTIEQFWALEANFSICKPHFVCIINHQSVPTFFSSEPSTETDEPFFGLTFQFVRINRFFLKWFPGSPFEHQRPPLRFTFLAKTHQNKNLGLQQELGITWDETENNLGYGPQTW